MATVVEIANDIFRINLVVPSSTVTYSLFVIRDDEPTLVETSFRRRHDEVMEAVRKVIDPRSIRHIVVPHFEGDECGGLNHFLEAAPHARAIASPIGARGSVGDFATREPLAADDGDTLSLGHGRLRFILTPQVHQWDSLMVFEETTSTLFSSDLFVQPGDGPATSSGDLTELMVEGYQTSGLMPSKAHLVSALDKLEALNPKVLACHHGTVITGNVARYFKALRENDVTASPPKPTPGGSY